MAWVERGRSPDPDRRSSSPRAPRNISSEGCQTDARLDAPEVRPGSAVGTRFSTGTSPINGTSSTPLDVVIPGQDTSAPIGTGFESRYENVGTANGASSSPEWKVSHKEMRHGMKTCPVRDCGYAGNNIEKHVYVSHLPACLNPILTFTPGQPHLPEERWQAICYLASLLGVSHPERLAEMAFTAIPPNHLRLGGGLSIGMAALAQYRGWEDHQRGGEWIRGRSPALILHWVVLTILVNRLGAADQERFARWTPLGTIGDSHRERGVNEPMELSPALPEVVEASPQVRLPASNSADSPIVIEDDDSSPSPVVEEMDIKPAMVSFASSAVDTLAQPIIVAEELTMDGAMEAGDCKPVVSGQPNSVTLLEARLSGLTTDGSVPMEGVQLCQAGSPGREPAEAGFEPVAGPSTTQPGLEPVAGPSTTQPSFAEVLAWPRTAPVAPRHREASPPEALDAHFHLKMPAAGVTLRQYLNYPMPHHQSYPVTLRGGVVVFCWPQSYPDNISRVINVPGFVATIGIHPSQAARVLPRDLEKLGMLIRSPKVSALGEIGLDGQNGVSMEKQEALLRQCLAKADSTKPVILHIRGKVGQDVELNARCRAMAQKYLEKKQPIQLHCFSCEPGVFAAWRKVFPQVYASISGMVARFNPRQKQELQEIPLDRLLLETDSPYLPIVGKVNMPHFVGDVASLVAAHRGERTQDVLAAANANCRSLFGL
ncbi:hypothetical protein RRG08_033864 [Elysia crispata]|uniref:Uncharacterized protein n=1 Tax=Elysia crispata TaxID=231223 RepID=A0AAE1B8V5_9GAST|nr:hypothetical protein RRG08_033864 [Elysia crispata]